MDMYVWKGAKPNFGDELNKWLMPRIFPPCLFEDTRPGVFLGIGSTLFDDLPPDKEKVVFGTGYGGYTPKPDIDGNWKIYAVRGPRTAHALRLPHELIATDAAVLLNRFRTKRPKTIRYAFMPHWESARRGYWRTVCMIAGMHYLDPSAPVDVILRDIESCELVISEAMHGVIAADALRTPWIAVKPFEELHHFKWFDWAESLGINLQQHRVAPSSIHEELLETYQGDASHVWNGYGWRKLSAKAWDPARIVQAAIAIRRLAHERPSLSGEAALERGVASLERAAELIKKNYC